MNEDYSVKGFKVSDPQDKCPMANKWTYAKVTNDQEGNPQSFEGPGGIEYDVYDQKEVDEEFRTKRDKFDLFAWPQRFG